MRLNTIVAIGLFGLALVAAVTVACSDASSCKENTLSLQIELGGTASFADSIIISSTTPGAEVSQTVPHDPNGNNLFTVDVTWPGGYPADKTVTFLVRATGGVTLLGENQAVIHLGATCANGFVAIRTETLDAAITD
jgi:hypothetical protein